MRYQVTFIYPAESTDDAILKLANIRFPAATTVLGMFPVPDPVFIEGLPQLIEDEGGSVEGVEEVEPPELPELPEPEE